MPESSTFIDTEGHAWCLRITLPLATRAQREESIDVFAIPSDEGAAEAIRSPIKLCNLLWCLVRDQAPEGVGPEEFASRLGDGVILRAAEALTEGIADFFGGHRQGQTIRKSCRLARLALDRMMDEAIDKMDDVETSLKPATGSADTSA